MSTAFTVVIPARYASTRLPGKPLQDIAGKPMVQHVWEQAKKSAAERVVVATDDARIVEACQAFGAEVVLTRVDHNSGTDRLAEVATHLGLAADAIVVNVQGDEPLIPPLIIDQVAANLARNSQAAIATLAEPIEAVQALFNPNVVKVVLDAQGLASYFSRAPIPWGRDFVNMAWWKNPGTTGTPGFAPLHHMGIYSYRAQFLHTFPTLSQAPTEQIEMLEQLRAIWHGYRIAVHVTRQIPGSGVDTPEDLVRVRQLLGATM